MYSQESTPLTAAALRVCQVKIRHRLREGRRKVKSRLQSTAYVDLAADDQKIILDAVNKEYRARVTLESWTDAVDAREAIVPRLGRNEYFRYEHVIKQAIVKVFNNYIHLFRNEGEDHPTVEELANRTT
ncbi:hypothetical protein PG997_002850 [Apiospora hydei]|uniref:Uncharacterized protein n=1 Tax=Apiospora hydei TaxID=1337664 RepID=A0ABR1WXN9_9PEZI